MNPTLEGPSPVVRKSLVLLFSAIAGFLVFFSTSFALPITRGLYPLHIGYVAVYRIIQAVVTLGMLVAALVLRRKAHLRPYWRLAFAYFLASAAIVLSGDAGDWGLALSGQTLYTAGGFTAFKLGEDVAIVAVIVVLSLLTRDDLRELFLSRGRLGLGLSIGIANFLVLTALGIFLTLEKGVQPGKLVLLLPAFLLIGLADGFMEDLLFRGLFLRRLGCLVGDGWAILLTTAVFTFMHLDVTFTTSLPLFLLIVFLLGLLWGWLMKRTGSLLAPALFHAGIDMLIMADTLRAFGVLR